MAYRRCGDSGLLLPVISLGLWHNFGGVDVYENARSLVHRAFDLGMTHFDLANNYGPPPGSAEETFGRILRQDLSRYRDEMVISTKAGYRMWPSPYGEWGSRKYLLASLDQSLRRLGLDYVDLFYSHRPDPDTPLEETMMALDQAVRQGKALYVGISNYDPDRTHKAADILMDLGTPLLVHQTSYSMLNRRPEQALFRVLLEEGIGCVAYSPLAQGLLTDRYLAGIPEGSRAARTTGFLTPEQVTEERVALARRLDALARARGQTLAQMALAWVLRAPVVTSALVGARRVEQLEDNIAAIRRPGFTDEELREIDSVLAG